ncbi:MAG: hypothetical protein IKY17_05180, partial [Oscillospiraceae bacterium]|nr:hypothetical protein [Oscillospiraceae bacterium]
FWFWDKSNGTDKVTVVFEGDNIVPKFQNPIPCGELKLAVGATLTAPDGLTVTTDAEGYIVAYKNGAYVAMPPVAKIGETGYATLADAINAATAGDTITLNGNVTENVTISKNLTIDGNGKTYTGTMNIGTVAKVTIENVNFVKGYIDGNTSAQSRELTVKNCTFDGVDKSIGYAITVRHGKSVTIENCSAKNYGIGMLYVPQSVTNITVKDVAVSDVLAAFNISYSGDSTFENVTLTNVTYGLHVQNHGARTFTMKGWKTDAATTYPIYVQTKGTATVTFAFEGENNFATETVYNSQYAKYVLAEAGATLTAPEGLTVTTSVNNATVEYKNGAYTVFKFLDGKGTEQDPILIGSAEDLIKFRNSVNAGEDRYNAEGKYVVLTADIDMAGIDWSVNIGDDCNATFDGIFDGQNHTISNLTSTETAQKADGYVCTGLFGAIAGNAVVKNLTIANATINTGDFTGNNAAAVVGFAYKATGSIENVKVINSTINAGKIDGTGAIVGYAYGGALTVKDCVVDNTDVTGQAYVGGVIGYADAKANLSGNTVQNLTVDATSCAVGGVAGIMLDGGVASGNTVKNVTMKAAHKNWQNAIGVVAGTFTGSVTVKNTTAEGNNVNDIVGALHAKKPTAPLPKAEAVVNDTYYGTFEAALAAANKGDTITLLVPYVVEAGEEVTIDLKGVTIVGTPTEAKAYAVITNRGTLTITDSVGGGSIVCDHKLAGSTSYAVNTIVNSGKLIIEGGVIENKSTASNQIGYAIDNNSTSYDSVVVINGGAVKASGSNYYDGIRLFCNNLTKENSVTVNGGEVSTIWMQNPSDGSADKNSKDVKGSIVIEGGKVGVLSLEPSSAFEASVSGGHVGEVSYFQTAEGRDLTGFITGGTFGADVSAFVAENYVVIKNSNGTYGVVGVVAKIGETGYATLADAIKAATAGQTITLNADVNENVTINRNLTIDGKDNNYTGTMTVNNVTVTIDNVNFVKG